MRIAMALGFCALALTAIGCNQPGAGGPESEDPPADTVVDIDEGLPPPGKGDGEAEFVITVKKLKLQSKQADGSAWDSWSAGDPAVCFGKPSDPDDCTNGSECTNKEDCALANGAVRFDDGQGRRSIFNQSELKNIVISAFDADATDYGWDVAGTKTVDLTRPQAYTITGVGLMDVIELIVEQR
jgi:hypothetical protein